MSYSAKVIADSLANGIRLTTLEVTFPRYILAEFNTHRVFSRNSASSRAIPVKVRVQQVRENPFVPEFTKNRAGMVADVTLEDAAHSQAEMIWRNAAKSAADEAEGLANIEVHKQQANRVLEPYVWHTALITSTEWENFWNLRMHKDASPEIQRAAELMYEAFRKSTPRWLEPGEWHLPYVNLDEKHVAEGLLLFGPSYWIELVKVSVSRCASVSFERQNVEKTAAEYAKRHDDHLHAGHMSPFEHQARYATSDEVLKHAYFKWNEAKCAFVPEIIGNFRVPWLQYRKTIPGEDVFRGE